MGRPKSVFSIWNKMHQEGQLAEVYDVFAIRIILDTDEANEKYDRRTYSIVTDFYQPNPDRLRDWISLPKANGYESLHTTVMSPTGKWVEVQIRSRRMDDMAEKGLAAHWRYKSDGGSLESDPSLSPTQRAEAMAAKGGDNIDSWLGQIREILEGGVVDALSFIDELKLNLFSDEVYVFTPNGEPSPCSWVHFARLRLPHPHQGGLPVHWRQGQLQAGATERAPDEWRPSRNHHFPQANA